MNPDEVQRFFDENGIEINIKKQTGLENVLRMGASSRLDHDKKWMAEVNVKAQQKIVEETDKAFKNVDFYDN